MMGMNEIERAAFAQAFHDAVHGAILIYMSPDGGDLAKLEKELERLKSARSAVEPLIAKV
jgi:hypothetical protein